VTTPNCVWVGDITSIWTSEGWLYLAVVIDLYSRRIVGWPTNEHSRTLDAEWLPTENPDKRIGPTITHTPFAKLPDLLKKDRQKMENDELK